MIASSFAHSLARRFGPAALVLAALALPGAAHAAETPVLRPAATVSGPAVLLGDLIAHAGPLADVPLFRAPDLGTTGPVAAADVVAAARLAGLTGIDTGGLSIVEVTRASRSLGADEVTAMLRERLSAAVGVTDPAALDISFRPAELPLRLPVAATGTPRITDATWSPADGSFRAIVAVATKDGGKVRRVVGGHAVATASVVIVTHDVERGAILGPGDVEVARRPRATLAGNSLVTAAAAVGLEAAHTLRAGDAVRSSDVAEPELVRRGELVTVVFKAPGMRLTLRGRALRAGRRGDMVSVMNLQSNRILQGTVSATGEVLLTPDHPVTTALR
jgi:flagella basal body P-ring formation protein FlgA